MHNINVNNISVQILFFPLHDEILFQGHGKSQEQDLQSGVMECNVFHDHLLQLHTLDNAEEDNDKS
jgi:hypothetical protein